MQGIVDRLGRVTERRRLAYQAFLYRDRDPNAAALADGRIYVTTGMLDYLSRRGSREDELAFVLAHELAHTVAQHLIQRYQTRHQQHVLTSLVAAGAALVTRGAGSTGQEVGQLALNAVSLLNDVAISGYSQQQELEADQLGIRYVMRAGYDPQAALDLLQDFTRFEQPGFFFRTHPYIAQRQAHLQRYLAEFGRAGQPQTAGSNRQAANEERRRQLRKVQELYPRGSVSWRNLQRQIKALK